jgi:hypothetical protein
MEGTARHREAWATVEAARWSPGAVMKSPIDACHHVAVVVRDAAAAREF